MDLYTIIKYLHLDDQCTRQYTGVLKFSNKDKCVGSWSWVIAINTCTIFYHTSLVDLFFSHNFCILIQNDSKSIGKVLMTIIHLALPYTIYWWMSISIELLQTNFFFYILLIIKMLYLFLEIWYFSRSLTWRNFLWFSLSGYFHLEGVYIGHLYIF